MKLRNKKTGEINLGDLHLDDFDSLVELNDEWEDYEEPKEYWFISDRGEIFHTEDNMSIDEKRKFFGNYFDTREEAEKAVEKLKAVKRLKDKSISFEVKVIDRKWYLEPKAEPQQRTFDEAHDAFKDIMFIFGGEE